MSLIFLTVLPCVFEILDVCVGLGDIIQLFILLGLAAYVWYTKGIANETALQTEYHIRPVIGALLDEKESDKAHVWFFVKNFSNTDAVGLVNIKLHVDGVEHGLEENQAYSGEEAWNFPAKQHVTGHFEFSGLLKRLNVISDTKAELRLTVCVYFKVWHPDKSKILKGKRYYSPVKRWRYSKEKWVPLLTSPSHEQPPEPNWDILAK